MKPKNAYQVQSKSSEFYSFLSLPQHHLSLTNHAKAYAHCVTTFGSKFVRAPISMMRVALESFYLDSNLTWKDVEAGFQFKVQYCWKFTWPLKTRHKLTSSSWASFSQVPPRQPPVDAHRIHTPLHTKRKNIVISCLIVNNMQGSEIVLYNIAPLKFTQHQ